MTLYENTTLEYIEVRWMAVRSTIPEDIMDRSEWLHSLPIVARFTQPLKILFTNQYCFVIDGEGFRHMFSSLHVIVIQLKANAREDYIDVDFGC